MAAAEARWLAVGAGLLGATAAGLLLAVPGAPALAPAEAPPAAAAAVALEQPPPRTQQEARGLIAACRQAGVGDAARLRRLALGADPLAAGNAITALGRLRLVHGDRELLRRLDDPEPRVRHELIFALGQSGEPAAAALLEPQLYGGDAQARCLSIQALLQLGATAPLQKLLADPSTDAATRAFVQAAAPPAAVPALLSTTGAGR